MTDARSRVERLWATPIWLLTRRSPELIELIDYESARWCDRLGWRDIGAWEPRARFARLLSALPEYRNLVLYRVGLRKPLGLLLRTVYRGEPTLHIHCNDIGRGLFIQHGFATTITAASIGEDCWIRQQTTIGFVRSEKPVLGNRVSLGAGVVLVGGITVGDDVVVGVNGTVVDDLPSNTVWVAPKAVQLERRAQGLSAPAS